uniref:Si:dkeyp-77h1.4 n=1 Tax=Xiphophorus maculatus TaxID=8083 RepID=A0A3B5Q9F0_XIPMA
KKCNHLYLFSFSDMRESSKMTAESVTLFHGEDFHILLPSQDVDVTFKNRSDPRKTSVLMKGGKVIGTRAKPTLHLNYINIEAVGEGDEGMYILKDSKDDNKMLIPLFYPPDCTIEQIIKYGGDFHMPVVNVNVPITLEYKPSSVEANLTSRPALVVLTATGASTDAYRGRITVSERSITISAVTGVDEGSYTVRDNKGVIKHKVCLNVIEHRNFVFLSADERLKINLILNSSLVKLHYTRDSDSSAVLLMDKGEFTSVTIYKLLFSSKILQDIRTVVLGCIKQPNLGSFWLDDKIHNLIYCGVQGLNYTQTLTNLRIKACIILTLCSLEKPILVLRVNECNTQTHDECIDSGVGFNTALPLDTDTDVPDQIPDSEAVSISVAPEIKPSPPSAAESKPAAPLVPEPKASPVPETKKAPDPPIEAMLDTPKPVDAKLSPTPSMKSGLSPAETKPAPSPSPEPKTGLSPADPKPAASPSSEPKTSLSPADPKPAPTPSPEPKISPPAVTTPTPDTKSPAASTPEPTKPSPAEPITNGTPDPGPDSKASPDHAEIIKDPTPKEVSTKTHEVELKSSSVIPEGSKDGAAAKDPTTT